MLLWVKIFNFQSQSYLVYSNRNQDRSLDLLLLGPHYYFKASSDQLSP